MAAGRASRRLAQLAAQAGGDRPFYVRRPIPPSLLKTFPAEGWYWRPPDHPVAVFLGASEIEANLALRDLIQRQEDAA